MGKVYIKKVNANDSRFKGRKVVIAGFDRVASEILGTSVAIPVDDTVVICNGCNKNLWNEEKPEDGYLVYFSKKDVMRDTPYDLYCADCVKRYFPKAIEVQ
jgi:hypothetical protein